MKTDVPPFFHVPSSAPSAGDPLSMASMPTMGGKESSFSEAIGFVDQYALVRKLGGGGFGVVYLARDTAGGVDVALKTLHPLLKRNAEEMEKLREKFALVSRLAHPAIATALVLHPVKAVSIPDAEAARELGLSMGDHVMVMRYAPGVTLSQWRRQFDGGVVPPGAVPLIVGQLAAALDYAHGEKIVHRDVKPSNIMVETLDEGSVRVRLLDFGLAAEIRSSMSRVSNEIGDTSGTRPYMAPEQWSGLPQDGRTDQYALACVLYELLSGAPPFAGVFETGDPAIMRSAVQSEPPRPVPGLSRAANAALLRALSKQPDARFPSCTAFAAALSAGLARGGFAVPVAGLGRLFSSERTSSRKEPSSNPTYLSVPSAPSAPPRGNRRGRAAAAVAALAAAAVAAAWFARSGCGGDRGPAKTPEGPKIPPPTENAHLARLEEIGREVAAETARLSVVRNWNDAEWNAHQKSFRNSKETALSQTGSADGLAAAEMALSNLRAEVKWLLDGDAKRKSRERQAADEARAKAARLERLRRIASAKSAGASSAKRITEAFRAYGDRAFSARVASADRSAAALAAIPDAADSRADEAEALARAVRSDVEWMEASADDRAKLEAEKGAWIRLLDAGNELEIRKAVPKVCGEADEAAERSANFEQEGDYARARVALAEAVGVVKVCIDGVKSRRATAAVGLARKFASSGQWEEAAAAAAQALSFDPGCAEAKALADEAGRSLLPGPDASGPVAPHVPFRESAREKQNNNHPTIQPQ